MNSYKQGFSDGLQQARKTVRQDIVSIYGVMAVLLLESGNSEEEVMELIGQIQDRWNEIVKDGNRLHEYLEKHLPFEIFQEVVE